jgi:hypothetical protein
MTHPHRARVGAPPSYANSLFVSIGPLDRLVVGTLLKGSLGLSTSIGTAPAGSARFLPISGSGPHFGVKKARHVTISKRGAKQIAKRRK